MKISIAALAFVLISSQAPCQDITKPAATTKLPFLMDRTDLALAGADLGLRTLDIYTSNRAFRDPCKCYYEVDPIAPTSTKGIIAFQLGAFALGQVARYELEKHHHRKLAKLLAIDVTSEAEAVSRNYYNLANHPRSTNAINNNQTK